MHVETSLETETSMRVTGPPRQHEPRFSNTKSRRRFRTLCFSYISVSHSTQNCLVASQSSMDGPRAKRGKMAIEKVDCEMWERGVFGRAHLVCSVNPRGLCFFAEGNARIVGPGDRGYGPARGPARQVGTNNKMKVS